MDLTLRVLGVVRSPLTDPATAPRFETENAPQAELVMDPAYGAAAKGLTVVCVSKDLPFALSRFCGAEGIDDVEVVSAEGLNISPESRSRALDAAQARIDHALPLAA